MASETITRNDLTTILNTLLPFSFTDFRYHEGSVSVPNSTLTSVHSETFEDGSWLILTTLIPRVGGSNVAVGQNRLNVNGELVTAHKDIADTSLSNLNFYVLESANNTVVQLDAFQATGNNQTQDWRYVAIRIGDKFAKAEADYVIEEGTSGIWTYRKWNSGIAECWGTHNWTNTAWTAWGNLFEGTPTYTNYPTGLFIATPNFQVTSSSRSTGFASVEVWTGGTESRTPQMFPVRGNEGQTNVDVSVDMHVIGRWK